MSSNDYGGRAYMAGILRADRSDADGADGRRHHALLGDGRVTVGLIKCDHVFVMDGSAAVDLLGAVRNRFPGDARPWGDDEAIAPDAWREFGRVARLDVAGHRVDVRWASDEAGDYVQARLTQPDGIVWTGWSGYGTGAGFDDPGSVTNLRRRAKMAWAFDGAHPAAPATRDEAGRCGMCGRPVDVPGERLATDCGGDCLVCMAECGDPDCVVAYVKATGRVPRHVPEDEVPEDVRPFLDRGATAPSEEART